MRLRVKFSHTCQYFTPGHVIILLPRVQAINRCGGDGWKRFTKSLRPAGETLAHSLVGTHTNGEKVFTRVERLPNCRGYVPGEVSA